MQPRNPADARMRHPFWVFAAFVLLAISFSLAVSHGRVVEAVLLGVLTLPPLAFVISWMLGRR